MPRRNRQNFEDRETDRKYIKFKMKRIKSEKQRGNHAAARRHATELLQYLNLGGSESPIEQVMNHLAQQEDVISVEPFRTRADLIDKAMDNLRIVDDE